MSLKNLLKLFVCSSAHSYFICLDDPCWKDVFTSDELKEIINEDSKPLPSINQDVQKILDRFQEAGAHVYQNNEDEMDDRKLDDLMLDTMIKEVREIGLFDPRTQYEEFWVISIITQLLGYYTNDVITVMGKDASELDLVSKFWCYFDRCFDNLRVNTTSDTVGHVLLAIKLPMRQLCKLVKEENDDVVPTKKEIVETESQHCPKTMKDILDRVASLVDFDKDVTKKLQFICFHQTKTIIPPLLGLPLDRRMKISFIDCPRGYTCRVMKSIEYEISTDVSLIPARIIPLLKLVLQAKGVVSRNYEGSDEISNEQTN
ncbi:hypothetical protein BDC45DRAFT_529271 [Circinella umbellata]|nr:hypothetical protein BDC45DRAFT_529271 [Circinella umbellata]